MFLNSFESIALFHLYGWGVLIKSIRQKFWYSLLKELQKNLHDFCLRPLSLVFGSLWSMVPSRTLTWPCRGSSPCCTGMGTLCNDRNVAISSNHGNISFILMVDNLWGWGQWALPQSLWAPKGQFINEVFYFKSTKDKNITVWSFCQLSEISNFTGK